MSLTIRLTGAESYNYNLRTENKSLNQNKNQTINFTSSEANSPKKNNIMPAIFSCLAALGAITICSVLVFGTGFESVVSNFIEKPFHIPQSITKGILSIPATIAGMFVFDGVYKRMKR